MAGSLDGFTRTAFSHDGATRDVYRRGTGPGVVVMHEIPGITPEVARFCRIVADAGFTVFVPDMFGTPGKPISIPYVAGQMIRACVSREFHVLASHHASPITEWLRALARSVHDELGGKGVGAIGMCLTGNFALALAIDPWLMAPVLSQPSLPFPLTAEKKRALHVSPEALDHVKRRSKEEGLRILGLRFHDDPLCPPERFERLRNELGDAFESIEIDPKHANPKGNPKPHSVVTTDMIDAEGEPTRQALDRVIALFRERL